jgi:hypothetical protein
MPRTSQQDIRPLVNDFIARLVAAVDAQATARVQQQVLAAIGGAGVRRGPGRPPKDPGLGMLMAKPRAKQLCPVPGCKNAAAPVFGMVCAQHKDVPKSKIKEYRLARRKAKQQAKGKN